MTKENEQNDAQQEEVKGKTNPGTSSNDWNFSYKLALPKLGECASYDHYKNELLAWSEFAGVPASRKAGLVVFSLPHNHESKIREKIFQSISVEKLKEEDGFQKIIEYMDTIFKKDVLVEAWQKFDNFENLKRKPQQEMVSFINDFDIAHNELVKLDLKIPKSLLAFKLMKNANITDQNRLLVLTGMNFQKKEELYDQAKASLKKFCTLESTGKAEAEAKQALKFESENVMMMNWRGRHNGAGGAKKSYGRGGQPRLQGGRPGYTNGKNPTGRDGKPLLCHICKSPEHLIASCPKNWNFLVNREDDHGGEVDSVEEEVVVMTSSVIVLADSLSQLTEKEGHAILDTACSSTVCGQEWLKAYVNTLSETARGKIESKHSSKKFKFGGGEVLQSRGQYSIPACLAGKPVRINTDVVDSEIPLLLSKDSMKAARIKLNLVDDTAEILGVKTSLNATASGHYYVDIGPEQSSAGETIAIESVCAVNLSKLPPSSLKKALVKIHRQFAHPSTERLKLLLKDCGSWRDNMREILDQIHAECDICKIYARTPARPAVAAPMAKEFNDKVAIDLKKWRERWILHIVDMWSRFTISVFINRKKPSEVIDKIMSHWIGAGYGIMGTLLSDNGGEFSAEEMREICSILNIEVLTTAAESPFQNGLCEKNHAIVDNMLLRLEEQCPDTPVDVLLCWANNAKNCLQMNNGFSSFQLLFGRNPRLPNVMDERLPAHEGTTTSETFARHLNGLHAARKAFIESETSERVRRALRSKVRTSEVRFEHGDKVFYKRENSEKWLGPGRVVFQDGKVIFVRHGGVFVRVSPNRLVKGSEYQSDPSQENTARGTVRGAEFDHDVRPHEEKDFETYVRCFSKNSTPNENPVTTRTDPTPPVQIDEEEPAPDMPVPGEIEVEASETHAGVQTPNSDITAPTVGAPSSHRRPSRNLPRPDYKKLHNVGKDPVVLANFSPKTNDEKDACRQAKLSEVQNWQNYGVYEEVLDEGQEAISTRWVLTQKEDDKGEKIVKARLVARGFEETVKSQADSPTAGKETLRLFLGLCPSLKWKCSTIDIRAAFLQGKEIDRTLFLMPPKDLKLEGKLWKLKRTVYGLVDASRSWYLSVRDALLALGCRQSKLDPALFMWYTDGEFSGMFAMHVDDFIWAGTASFQNKVIEALSQKFEIGKEAHDNFRYIGLDIVQEESSITMSQLTYSEDVDYIEISKSRQFHKHLPVSEDERKRLRGIVGKLNWMATQTRPDLSFETLDLSMGVNHAKVEDLLKANKAVRQLKNEQCCIRFPDLGDLGKLHFVVYSDASHANLRDGVSSGGGYVVLLVGENGESCPLMWKSAKIKRVVKSTLSAESMALVNATDDTIYLRHLLYEIIGKPNVHIPIDAYVDNRSLVENLLSTKGTQEKALRIDLAILKDLVSNGDIRRVQWVESKCQLADSLTKRGPSTAILRNVFSHGLKFMPSISK